MCFYGRNCRPYAKKVHSVPCLTGEHGRAEADGRLLQRKKCRTLDALLRNVFISDVVRLVWLLNRFNEDVDFSNYSDFLLQRGRFDRLCWQLVFGTFFSESDGMESDHLGTWPAANLKSTYTVLLLDKVNLSGAHVKTQRPTCEEVATNMSIQNSILCTVRPMHRAPIDQPWGYLDMK